MNEPSIIPAIRDLSIIFPALESIVVLVLLSILIVQIRALVILLNDEIKPMLEATQETADTVRNTTNFVSKRVARPFVSAISFGAGVRQAVKTVKQQVVPSKNKDAELDSEDTLASDSSELSAPEPPVSASDMGETTGADNG
ncbi:MAG: hypothetical protein GY759_17440 [Chloroflexi bacterium]|nr:hypothetical protein [Chloroflexota bacterium]